VIGKREAIEWAQAAEEARLNAFRREQLRILGHEIAVVGHRCAKCRCGIVDLHNAMQRCMYADVDVSRPPALWETE
jgi:hypothetical protein